MVNYRAAIARVAALALDDVAGWMTALVTLLTG
jgi:hypothetical protein